VIRPGWRTATVPRRRCSTPSAPILEGITRDTLVVLAKELGYEVVEQSIARDQLYMADEVFVCGTAAECVALREVDFRTIGKGVTGPVTRALQKAYHSAVRGAHPRSKEWCSEVREARRYPAPVRLARGRRSR